MHVHAHVHVHVQVHVDDLLAARRAAHREVEPHAMARVERIGPDVKVVLEPAHRAEGPTGQRGGCQGGCGKEGGTHGISVTSRASARLPDSKLASNCKDAPGGASIDSGFGQQEPQLHCLTRFVERARSTGGQV